MGRLSLCRRRVSSSVEPTLAMGFSPFRPLSFLVLLAASDLCAVHASSLTLPGLRQSEALESSAESSELFRPAGPDLQPSSPILTGPGFHAPPLNALGAIDLGGSSRRLDVKGGYAYLAQEFFGFTIVDVSDATQPLFVSETAIVGSTGVYDLDEHGGFLYVAANEAGMLVYDVQDPLAPVLLHQVPSFRFGGSVLGVFAEDTRLFVTAGEGGVSVWDISDPFRFDDTQYCAQGKPTYCGDGECVGASLLGCHQDFPFVDYYRDGVLSGDLLVTATAAGGVVVLDVSDPSAIVQLGSTPQLPGQVLDVAVGGSLALGASIQYGASGPALPLGFEGGLLPLVFDWATGGFEGAEGIEIGQSREGRTLVYVASGEGLDVLDATDPGQPVLLETLEKGWAVRDALVVDGRLYLAAGTRGLAIYEPGL